MHPSLNLTEPLRDAGATIPDFTRREYALRELMDEPCDDAEYRRAALSLAKINRLTRGVQPTLAFLERVQREATSQPLHIVDVGCASGDTLRTLAAWSARHHIATRLTGIDINPRAARLARELDREQGIAAGRIEWITADAFAVDLDHPADIVLASLFTHHLDDASVTRFLTWAEANARVGWMINDLERSERSAKWFARLGFVLRWHRFMRYDGLVSFRRAFSRDDWSRYLAEANIHEARVYGVRPSRLCVERIKH